jgi:hypothetical protein
MARRRDGAAMSARAGKLIRLLGSDREGEALAAGRALGRLLAANRLDWHWLADLVDQHFRPPSVSYRPEWRLRAENLIRRGGSTLTNAERYFLAQIAEWSVKPSSKQLRWLAAIERALTGQSEA